MDLDKILLFEGLKGIGFGATKQEIVVALGVASEQETCEDGDIGLYYDDQDLEFTLWADEEGRLGVIDSERDTLELHGIKLRGKSKAEVREFVAGSLKSCISEEDGWKHDDGEVQELIEVDEKSLTFWFRDDSLYLVSWSCEWADEDHPKWPA